MSGENWVNAIKNDVVAALGSKSFTVAIGYRLPYALQVLSYRPCCSEQSKNQKRLTQVHRERLVNLPKTEASKTLHELVSAKSRILLLHHELEVRF